MIKVMLCDDHALIRRGIAAAQQFGQTSDKNAADEKEVAFSQWSKVADQKSNKTTGGKDAQTTE